MTSYTRNAWANLKKFSRMREQCVPLSSTEGLGTRLSAYSNLKKTRSREAKFRPRDVRRAGLSQLKKQQVPFAAGNRLTEADWQEKVVLGTNYAHAH